MISNENLYTILLHFSNEDLIGSENFKVNSLHIVNIAKLTLSVTQIKSTKENHIGKSVKFTVYQLTEDSKIRPEAAIAMESQAFEINEDFDDDNKIDFDASEIVQSWFLDETSNQGLRIECDLCHEFGLQFSSENVYLTINVESTNNQMDMTRRATLNNFWSNSNQETDCPEIRHKRKPRCCRESMVVDFTKISGNFLTIFFLFRYLGLTIEHR